MAWNEPGNNQPEDPWKKRGGDQGPPDLDELLKKFQDRMGGMFGGGGSSGSSSSPSFFPLVVVIAVIGLLFWAASGFYTIDEGQRGVVLRFGKYHETTNPGLRWHLPSPIEWVEVVNIGQVRTLVIGSAGQGSRGRSDQETLMLTKDENIVEASIAVQYQVNDPKKFLFEVERAEDTLNQIAQSALREVVGKFAMDYVLVDGREEVALETKALIQQTVDQYNAGIEIKTVNLQDVQAPDEVQAAFEDAIKAREDKERKINEAQAYANEVIPQAEGRAARYVAEANAYKSEVVERAKGDASRFVALLNEYKKAPEVTRDRIFIESIQKVLKASSKVLIDEQKNGNTMMYLPLDQLRNRSANISYPSENYRNSTSTGATESSPQESDQRDPYRNRSREIR